MGQIIDDKKIEFYSRLVAADGIQERTASRLKEMAAIGMMELGNASFGLLNVMDGMYVERVWNMDDHQFTDYMNWVKELAAQKAPAIAKAKEEVFALLRAQKGNGADVLSGKYEYRFDRLLVKVTRTVWDNFCIYYSTGNIGSSSYKFYTTEYELFGTNMSFGEAVRFLNIYDYKDRIVSSNSHGELFHLLQYIHMAEYLIDNKIDPSGFREWFEGLVKEAEATWKRPASMFQHMDKVFGDYLNKKGHDQVVHKVKHEEEVGLVPIDYPDTHAGLDLSNVYRLYKKVICVEQARRKMKWEDEISIGDNTWKMNEPVLYYPPYGLAWMLQFLADNGCTMVQLRCRDEKGELGYPDYKISELIQL